MTANQIAYAQEQLGERVADETERHNRATEENATKLADLERVRLEYQRQYNNDMIRLKNEELALQDKWKSKEITNQATYNTMWEAIQNRKADIEEAWNNTNAKLLGEQNTIKINQQNLDYQLAVLKSSTDKEIANLRDKQATYDRYAQLFMNQLDLQSGIFKEKLKLPGAGYVYALGDAFDLGGLDFERAAENILNDNVLGPLYRQDDPNHVAHNKRSISIINRDEVKSVGDLDPVNDIERRQALINNRSTSKMYFRGRPMN